MESDIQLLRKSGTVSLMAESAIIILSEPELSSADLIMSIFGNYPVVGR